MLLYLDGDLLKRHWFEFLARRMVKTFTAVERPLLGLLEGLLTPIQAHVESLICGTSFLSEEAKAEAVPTSQVVHLCRKHQDFPSNSSCTWHWNVHHFRDINGINSFQRGLTKKEYFFGVTILKGRNQDLATLRGFSQPHIKGRGCTVCRPLKPFLGFQGFTDHRLRHLSYPFSLQLPFSLWYWA